MGNSSIFWVSIDTPMPTCPTRRCGRQLRSAKPNSQGERTRRVEPASSTFCRVEPLTIRAEPTLSLAAKVTPAMSAPRLSGTHV
jgi:hypothetical protein